MLLYLSTLAFLLCLQEEERAIKEQEQKEQYRARMLANVMNEIITTERDYVKDLTFITEVEDSPFSPQLKFSLLTMFDI